MNCDSDICEYCGYQLDWCICDGLEQNDHEQEIRSIYDE